jgi:hypothetical protein
LRALHALRTLWTGRALGAGCTGCTLRSRAAGPTRIALRALHALRALRSRCTCWPSWPGSARCTGFTLIALRPLLAFWALRTLRTLNSLRTFRPGRALRREHVDLEVIVADNIDDKIRNSERGQEEIAQTLTSRCSMRG